jgi:hypothetical protein
MNYSSVTQIRQRLPQIAEEILSDEQVETLIAHMDGLINSYLRLKYQLPLSNTDSLVSYISLELSCAAVLEGVYGVSEPENAALAVTLRERALNFLRANACGEIALASSVNACSQPVSRTDSPEAGSSPSQFCIPHEALLNGDAS